MSPDKDLFLQESHVNHWDHAGFPEWFGTKSLQSVS